MAERFTLHRVFFSCCFPEEEDRNKLAAGEIEITESILANNTKFGNYVRYDVIWVRSSIC